MVLFNTLFLTLPLLVGHCTAEYIVTIHPEFLAQNGRTRYEVKRWNSHNGLDKSQFIAGNKATGTRTGRWIFPDVFYGIFENAKENPKRKGYPDPSYFNDHKVQASLCSLYVEDMNAYGRDLDLIMEPKGKAWPKWMNTSLHGGLFPNNLDAGAEMMLLMVEAVSKYTGGTIPSYFEVMNEPETLWPHVKWDRIIEFHKLVYQKLHAKFPKMKIGGPTQTGQAKVADKDDFRIWKNMRAFMDMGKFDFYSFHPYNNFFSSNDKHHFTGFNEARLFAVIDLLESYAYLKTGKDIPLIISEYGLAKIFEDAHSTAALAQWAYAYQHNGHLFTFLNHRGVMEKTVSFLLNMDRGRFVNSSIFYADGSETHVAKALHFWKHFYYDQQFLRVESQYDSKERKISPLAVADAHNKKVTVLLHNYQQSSANVRLNFYNKWINPTSTLSTCLYLDSHKNPILREGHQVHLTGNVVSVPAEASCLFTFQTGHNFGGTPTVHENTYYSRNQAISIHNKIVNTVIKLPSSGNLRSGLLRFGVSNPNKHVITTPKSVHINGHSVTDHFSLYDADREASDTLWEVYNYRVPGNALKHGENTVRLEFTHNGGYVSTVALLAETLSGGGGVVG